MEGVLRVSQDIKKEKANQALSKGPRKLHDTPLIAVIVAQNGHFTFFAHIHH
jgi:hypothetical protein